MPETDSPYYAGIISVHSAPVMDEELQQTYALLKDMLVRRTKTSDTGTGDDGIRAVVAELQQALKLPTFGPWVSVNDNMPEDRMRVWASTGPCDIGHDCFFGTQSDISKDMTRMWRYTETEEPVRLPVTHWRSMPVDPPPANPAPR